MIETAKRIISRMPMAGHQTKEGEKTKSEWEKLEEQSKDELIIELVRMRTLYSILREQAEAECPLPKIARSYTGDEPGETTVDSWAEKIALYAAKHPKDGMFYSCDLMDYGLTSEQADRVCEKLRKEGRLALPEGTRFGDDST